MRKYKVVLWFTVEVLGEEFPCEYLVDAVSADQALEIAKRNLWRALRDSSNNQYEYCIQGYTVRFGKR